MPHDLGYKSHLGRVATFTLKPKKRKSLIFKNRATKYKIIPKKKTHIKITGNVTNFPKIRAYILVNKYDEQISELIRKKILQGTLLTINCATKLRTMITPYLTNIGASWGSLIQPVLSRAGCN